MPQREPAREPEDLDRLFLERAIAGDVEGVIELYEADAVLAFPLGEITVDRGNIRVVYHKLISSGQKFQGEVRNTLVNCDIPMTSTTLPGTQPWK